ncbi:MAG: thioesterase family protein [Planctomycetota bacterium]|nr:thioesterase family protein [Planctomycetota bacterium]
MSTPAADPFRFATATPLRWVDVDSEGVVNNAVYASLMEQARYRYFDDLGLLEDGRLPFVLAESTIRYLLPGRLGMDLVTAARVTRVGRTSFGMEYEVRAQDAVLASGSAVLVYIDGDLRPIPIAESVKACLHAFEGLADTTGPVA